MHIDRKALSRQVSRQTGVELKTAEKCVVALLVALTDALAAHNTVTLRNFGRFGVRHIPEKAVINPRTKECMTTPAHWRPVFQPGAYLKQKVNEE